MRARASQAAELAHQRSVPPPADPAHATYDADVYELSRGVSCPAGGGQQHGMPPARVRGLASSETVGGAAHADLARVRPRAVRPQPDGNGLFGGGSALWLRPLSPGSACANR